MTSIQGVKQRFGIIGNSPQLNHALGTAIRVSATDLSVLITGPSGVGKENFSKIIHSLSPRKHNPFIAVNCGAIPEGTINSELFGHEKGAFTGATSERKGYFETVNNGTIFLDEIGEMPPSTQSYLLRVLENGEFIRVGSSKVQKTNVRVIAATNVDLRDKVNSGKFREDLYYRLNTVPIAVPALKERREDIWMLFRKFSIDFAEFHKIEAIQLESEARFMLENYSWPGNVRELKNIAEQISILSEERVITADMLRNYLPRIGERHLPAIRQSNTTQTDLQEREILYKLLFDMKSDLNDLKSVVHELIRDNDLTIKDNDSLDELRINKDVEEFNIAAPLEQRNNVHRAPQPYEKVPIYIQERHNFEATEVVEENLSLEEMERELIQKALKKHNNRRREASKDLGISERTLYRKIKQYQL